MFYNNNLLFYNNPMAIVVRLDRLLLERRMTLTELAERVGITIVNLSILKTNKVGSLPVSRGTCWSAWRRTRAPALQDRTP
jgi:hypothetical protein